MWIQQTLRAKFTEVAIALLAFSKDKYGENTLATRLQQPVSNTSIDFVFGVFNVVPKKKISFRDI